MGLTCCQRLAHALDKSEFVSALEYLQSHGKKLEKIRLSFTGGPFGMSAKLPLSLATNFVTV